MSEGNFKIGDQITAQITRIVPAGIGVKTAMGGKKGFIRKRELVWKRSSDIDVNEMSFNKGDLLSVVVLECRKDGGLTLSLRRAKRDPWVEIEQGKYQFNQTITGKVVNITSYGAFVEIEPGVDGLLRTENIPHGHYKEIQNLLWVGDYVNAVITKVDTSKREIDLSIEARLVQLKRARKISARFSITKKVATSSHAESKGFSRINTQILGEKIRCILIVDDDAEFSNSLAEWLSKLGYTVETVDTGKKALETEFLYDLVFLDIDLPDANGIDIADKLLQTAPSKKIIFCTGLFWLEKGAAIPDDLEVAAVILKPLDFSEVVNILRAFEEGTQKKLPLKDTKLAKRDTNFLERISVAFDTDQYLRISLEKTLAELREMTNAKTAIVFSMDTITRRISITASSGLDNAGAVREKIQSLRFSQVKNVAIDNAEIAKANIPYRSKHFEKMFIALDYFKSCVGLPIPQVEEDIKYALFLLNFSSKMSMAKDLARGHSYLIATELQNKKFRFLIEKTQRSLVTGQLASSLLHEIRNKVNRVEQHAQLMKLDRDELKRDIDAKALSVWAERFEERVSKILNANAELRELTLEYLGLMGIEKLASVDINQILRKTIRQIRSTADDNRVTIVSKLDSTLPNTTTIQLRLEQVFLNVALNAIQQMAMSNSFGKQLKIISQYDHQDKNHPIKLRFLDEGPGIHRKRWDWIFKMGTSTREGGAGLGLFGSKGILESMGGKISVESSYMFVGSQFLIELPVLSSEEIADV